jgi:cytochrome c biogenesis factor|uniref:Cytochrome c-type biogenesis protein n=1 Tax=Diphylleia rotans TaxID=190327 RepID=A0A146I6Q8_9EUKA|nr:cytochrome c-type biogenesis protein [Diphylleia rotans]BAU71445.1 cytochrome c-type biogenesis protein [Diphylleia rotans]
MDFRTNIKGNSIMGGINAPINHNFEKGLLGPFSLYLLNIILILVVTSISFGTLAPVIFYFLIGRDISIGESFFIKTTAPLAPNILLLLNNNKVKGHQINSILEILGIFIVLCLVQGSLFYNFLLSLIIWLCCQYRDLNLGHYGLLLFILGIILNDINKVEIISQISVINPILATNSEDYLVFRGVAAAHGPNYFSLYGGPLLITKENSIIFYPEKRYYYTQNLLISKIEVHTNLISDLYCYLGEGNILNGWRLRLIYNPYQIFIWLGPLVSILGIIKECALFKKRKGCSGFRF